MRTGQFNQRITFTGQTALEVAPNGDINGTSTQERVLWAKVTPLKGTRALYYGQIANGHLHEIRIRFQPNWAPQEEMLITWKGKTLTITSIADVDYKHQEYLLLAVSPKQGAPVSIGQVVTPPQEGVLGTFPIALA